MVLIAALGETRLIDTLLHCPQSLYGSFDTLVFQEGLQCSYLLSCMWTAKRQHETVKNCLDRCHGHHSLHAGTQVSNLD